MRVGEDRERDGVADGLVKSRVRARSKDRRLMTVRHKVLDVAHLVMNSAEIVVVDLRAHFYSRNNNNNKKHKIN